MPSHILDFVNNVRSSLKLDPVNHLPAGKVQSQYECPVSLAISMGSTYRAQVCYDLLWIYDRGKVKCTLEVPKEVGRFIAEFDLAQHPDLILI